MLTVIWYVDCSMISVSNRFCQCFTLNFHKKQVFLRKYDLPQAAKKSKNKHISAFLRIFVAVVAIYFVFRGEDLGEIASTFMGVNPLVMAAAICLFLAGQFVFVLRWQLLLRAQEIRISYFIALKLHFLGLFYNNCLPGAMGGDLLRAWYATTHTDKKTEAVLSVFFDRAIGFGGMLVMAAVFYWMLIRYDQSFVLEVSQKTSDGEGLGGLVWVLVAIPVICALFGGVLAATGRGRSLLARVYNIFKYKGLTVIKKAMLALKLYCTKPLVLVAAILLTVVCQSLAILSYWVVCRDMQIKAPLICYFAFFPTSWLIGVIPVSIGGAGVMEGGLKVLFSKITTVAEGQEVIPGLVQRLIFLTVSMAGLIVHIKGSHLPEGAVPDAVLDKPEISID